MWLHCRCKAGNIQLGDKEKVWQEQDLAKITIETEHYMRDQDLL